MVFQTPRDRQQLIKVHYDSCSLALTIKHFLPLCCPVAYLNQYWDLRLVVMLAFPDYLPPKLRLFFKMPPPQIWVFLCSDENRVLLPQVAEKKWEQPQAKMTQVHPVLTKVQWFSLNKCFSIWCLTSANFQSPNMGVFVHFIQFYDCFWWRGLTEPLTSPFWKSYSLVNSVLSLIGKLMYWASNVAQFLILSFLPFLSMW